jgi:hypothetical protein
LVALVMIKEAFFIDPQQQVARTHDAEIRMVDVPWNPDEPESSTTKFPSDMVLFKPSTDVVVAGDAMAPGMAPSQTLDVLVRVGPVQKLLRVFGARVFYRGAVGLAMSAPLPFERLPLRWELAYGGADFSDPKKPWEEPRNPAGRGLARNERDLIEKLAPQIETHQAPLLAQGPVPAGVAPIGRHWEPRRRYTGTYDETWKKTRMPLPPLDFDARFNQVAPPELITPSPLRGGELVQLHNMNMAGSLQFELPRLHFFVGLRSDSGWEEARPVLDTVVLQPNERRFELTYRSCLRLPKRSSDLRYVQVHEKAPV